MEDLTLYFTLPGNDEYELLEGGAEIKVTLENVESYLDLCYRHLLDMSVSFQVDCLRSGFNDIFPISHLTLLSPDEIQVESQRLLTQTHTGTIGVHFGIVIVR